ncbi:MAG: radical SAM family heme chaperone HemW [Lachnospiraceae bacterium]|nr:radical SAM family heme chaperone HemW [Lachnospiraceae bacterium]
MRRNTLRELEIYIHIPFCVKKCAYCDFLSAPAKEEQRDHYVRMLIEEIRQGQPLSVPRGSLLQDEETRRIIAQESAPQNGFLQGNSALENPQNEEYSVTSVFIGGGTPSLLSGQQIAAILEALRAQFHFADDAELSSDSRLTRTEITMECNPGTLDEQRKMKEYRACGVNRISFGLQSADNAELAELGRIHTWETFLRSYEAAREAGFSNINVDLMSALPGQTVASWEQTLQKILKLAPEHISAYSLIIEEGTPFYDKYHEDDERRADGDMPRFLPSEDDERRMYGLTEQMLHEAGYEHYEISNYARPDYACRHNIGYWRGTEYMGFGLGAASLLRYPFQNQPVSVRCKNPVDHAEYAELVTARSSMEAERQFERQNECEILSIEDEMSEFMFLGLRMLSGVSEQEFFDRFRRPIDAVYGEALKKLISLQLLKRENGRIFLTPRGLDISNPVMAEFLL